MEFEQIVKNVETGALCLKAELKAATTNSEGKLYRKIPQILIETLKEYVEP